LPQPERKSITQTHITINNNYAETAIKVSKLKKDLDAFLLKIEERKATSWLI